MVHLYHKETKTGLKQSVQLLLLNEAQVDRVSHREQRERPGVKRTLLCGVGLALVEARVVDVSVWQRVSP